MKNLKNKVAELRNKWLNQEITLWDLDGITETEMCGKFDLKRDLMNFGSENEGSYDDGEVNFEFKFIDGEEIKFDGKVIITAIYEL